MTRSAVIFLMVFSGQTFAESMWSFDESDFKQDINADSLQPTGGPVEGGQALPPNAEPPSPQPTPQTPDSQMEAGYIMDCQNCRPKNLDDLKAVVAGKVKLASITSWRRNRGLVQIPTKGKYGNIGPCGSFHYSPDQNRKGEIMDNWTSPAAACTFMSVLQDWKKRCPDSQAGCRVAWGDISHKEARMFNGHHTHTEGNCIDIRPMRRGGFDNAPLYYPESDRNTTKEFVKMLYKNGASVIYYNDPKAGATPMSGHSNHVHVCFPSSKKTREVCANYQYDPKICGPDWSQGE